MRQVGLVVQAALICILAIFWDRVHGKGDKRSILILYNDAKLKPTSDILEYFERADSELIVAKSLRISDIGMNILYSADGLLYDNILLLGSNLPKQISNEDFIEFVRLGGNLLWSLEYDDVAMEEDGLDTRTKKLISEFGRIIDGKPAKINDYINSPQDPLAAPLALHPAVGERIATENEIIGEKFSGFSHRLNSANPLAFPILTGRTEAIGDCSTKNEDYCIKQYGSDIIAVSALQSLGDARVTISTINGLFSTSIGGKSLIQKLISWTFKETGIIRVDSYEHINLDERHDGKGYRIDDTMQVRLCLSVKTGPRSFSPIQPTDIYLEFIMMHPWVRAYFHPTGDGCLSTGPITLPNKYGLFTLRTGYQPRGYAPIVQEDQIILRTYHHDEIPRFEFGALPYYISWYGMMISASTFLIPLALNLQK